MRLRQWFGWVLAIAGLLTILDVRTALAMREPGDWVTITLRDGREVTGEVVEESAKAITVEIRFGTIKQKQTFDAYDVVEIERHARPADAAPKEQRTGPKAQGGYVVVPTTGVFGKEITANLFRTAIEDATKRGAEAIIFELESPGGYLFGLHQIYDVIQEHRDDIKIVFYVNGDCFSAAALVCLATDYFYVGPRTAFGAAVVIQANAEGGHDAVEQKFAAAEAAKWRQRVDEAKHPSILVDPLMLMEAELWADTSTTPWTLYKSEPKDLGPEAKVVRIDSNQTVLGATQEELVKYGAVNGTAETFREVLRQLDLENPGHEAADGKKVADTVKRVQDGNLRDIDRQVQNIQATVAAIKDSKNVSQYRTKLRGIKGSLDRIRKMMDELDYVEFHCRVERGITDELLNEWNTAVTAALKSVETAR